MLEEYFLLVRRIQGIGLSLDDYWQMDSWTTAKLLTMERAIIDEEIKNNPDYKNKYDKLKNFGVVCVYWCGDGGFWFV